MKRWSGDGDGGSSANKEGEEKEEERGEMESKLRGGSTNPNAYNQFLMIAERNRGHMY